MLTERESQESSANDGVFPPQLFEDEVEVAPGIYLIKRKAPLPSDPLSLPLPTAASSTAGSVAGGVMHGIVTQSDNLEFLMQEADRLKNSVNLLLRTNDELRQYDSSDSVFQEAIRENIVVVDRQMRMIKSITERSQQLLGQMEAAGCLDAPDVDISRCDESHRTTEPNPIGSGPQLEPEQMQDETVESADQEEVDSSEGIYL